MTDYKAAYDALADSVRAVIDALDGVDAVGIDERTRLAQVVPELASALAELAHEVGELYQVPREFLLAHRRRVMDGVPMAKLLAVPPAETEREQWADAGFGVTPDEQG